MFNSGYRGDRAGDNKGIVSPQTKFIQTEYPIPTITSYSLVGTDDLALSTAGGQTVLVNGTGFAPGCSAIVNGITVSPVTVISPTQISFTSPAVTGGTYSLVIYNSTGGGAILVPGLVYSSVPYFTTDTGLSSVYETQTISTNIVAVSDSNLTYTLTSGSLPDGASISSSGLITGTAPVTAGSTTYTFTVTATDAELQDVTKTFTLTINTDVITWATPANNSTITLGSDLYTQTLSATAASGSAISYAVDSLPAGLTLSNGSISGTATQDGTFSSVLTATADTTTRTGTSTVTWVVQLSSQVMFTSILLSADSSVQASTFLEDNSPNNHLVTVVADTKADQFTAFQPGYYSTFFPATANYLSGTTTFNPTSQTRAWTVEFWFMPLNTTSVNIFAIGGGSAYGNSLLVNWSSTAGKFSFYQGNGTSNPVNIVTTNTYAVSQWHHVAITNDGLGVRRMFINGVLDGTQTYTTAALVSATTFVVNGAYDNVGLGTGGGTFYISNLRIVPDQALYTGAFTIPTTPALPISGTALLFNSNKFADSSITNTSVTVTGTPRISSHNPYGTPYQVDTQYYSTILNGTTDHLTIPASPSFSLPGDFTIEAWVYMTSPSSGGPYSIFGTGSATTNFDLRYYNNVWQMSMNSGSGLSLGGTGTLVPNTWTHVALVKAGYYSRLYVNGVYTGTQLSSTNTMGGSTTTAYIGASDSGPGNHFNGIISNFRFTKGYAVYTGNFTPSSSPLTATTSVPAQQTWSVSLDGTGDYLTVPSSTVFAHGTGSYTIEAWIYPTSRVTEFSIWSTGAQNNNLALTTGGLLKFYNGTTFTGTTVFPLNTWAHIALVRTDTGTNGTRLYVNGALELTFTDATNQTAATTGIIGINTVGGANLANGFISNLRVVKGQELYTSAFVPSTSPLTTTSQGAIASNVSLLTCQNNLLQDNSTNYHRITAVGDARTSAMNPFASNNINGIGGTSCSTYFDGTGDYLTLPSNQSAFTMGTGDFTIEMWVNITSLTTQRTLYDTMNQSDATGTGRFAIQVTTGGVVQLFSLAGTILTSGGTLVANTWYHLAYSRSSGSGRLFVNGVQVNTTYSDSNNYVVGSTLRPIIGINAYDNSSSPMLGHISNLRVVKGQALYTSNFSPSTTPLTTTSQGATASNVSLLTCQSPTVIDNSTNNFTITAAGDARTDTYNPFSIATSLLTCQSSTIIDNSAVPKTITASGSTKQLIQSPNRPSYYSNYFNGSSISVPNTSQATLNVAANATFTIEAWINIGSLAAAFPVVVDNVAGNSLVYWNFTVLSTGYLSFAWYPGATTTCTATTTAMTVGNWYHVAVSVNAGVISLYVNGVPQTLTGTTTLSTPSANTGTITIGQYASPVVYSYGYISNVRITKNQALYTAAFTPSTSPLTTTSQGATASNVSLLTCQSLNFVDNSTNQRAITRNGTPLIGGVSPFTQPSGYTTTPITSYGSAYFDGTGDYLITPASPGFAFGSGDFTLEGFFYFVSRTQSYPTIFQNSNSASLAANIWWFGYDRTDSAGAFRLYVGNVNTVTQVFSIASPYSLYNRWAHIALVRRSNTYYLYLDGISIGSVVSTPAIDGGLSETLYIGALGVGTPNAYISDVRVTKGTALYSNNFQPQFGSPLPVSGNTQLLTLQNSGNHNNSAIIDNSRSNNVITRVGNVTSGTFSPYGTNYSTYFSGTGSQWLSLPAGTGTSVDLAGDFTFECWVYPTARLYLYPTLIDTQPATNDATRFAIWMGHNSFTTTKYQINAGGSTTNTNASIVYNAWTHIAVTRVGTTMYVYLNGTLDHTKTAISASLSGTTTAYLGGSSADAANCPMQGYVTNLRIVRGRAIYLGNFTPSKVPLTTVSGTSLLTFQRGNQVDLSVNNTTLTQSGTPSIQRFSPFNHTTLPAINYSTYFDGTGDMLNTTMATPGPVTISGNFTVEAWIYPTSATTLPQIFQYGVQKQAYSADYAIGLNRTGGYIMIAGAGGAGTQYTATFPGSATAPINQWSHIALVRNNNVLTAYLNGVAGTGVAASGTIAPYLQRSDLSGSLGYWIGTDTTNWTTFTPTYFTGYIYNLRAVKNQALYTANFTPSAELLTNTSQGALASNVMLLACQSNRNIDNSTNNYSITVSGDVKPRPVSPYSDLTTGTYNSFQFDGTGDYITYPTNNAFILGTKDFTFECWAYIAVNATNSMIVGNGVWATNKWALQTNATNTANKLTLWVNNYSTTNPMLTSSTTLSTGTWYHFAVTRSGVTWKLFVNGVQEATVTSSISIDGSVPTNLLFGSDSSGATTYFNGYLSNIRVLKDLAVYTAGFTPSTAPLTLTTTVSTAQTNSVTFDGIGDYLTATNNAAFTLGTGDFTIEAWIYPTSSSGVQGVMACADSGSAGDLTFFYNLTSGKVTLNAYGGTAAASTASITTNTWTHVAFSRQSGSLKTFINGALDNTVAFTGNFTKTALVIGRSYSTLNQEYFTGAISNLRITKGQAVYTAAFTPSTTPLTTTSQGAAAANVSLLTCQDKLVKDNSSNYHRIAAFGDARPASMNPFVSTNGIGGTSYSTYFDGTGDYLNLSSPASTTIGSNSFTWEAWIHPTAVGTFAVIYDTSANGDTSATGRFLVTLETTGQIKFTTDAGTTVLLTSGSNYVSNNTWTHLAIVRSGTSGYMFFNGVQVATGTVSTNFLVATQNASNRPMIGANGYNGNNGFTGYISNLRLVIGTALYTTNFSPSTIPLTAISGTQILTCQSTSIIDNSSNAHVITVTGNTTPSPINPFSGATVALTAQNNIIVDNTNMNALIASGDAKTSAVSPFTVSSSVSPAVSTYSTSLYGGSLYFDGTGDYLTIPGSINFNLSSGAWTIECWVYQDAAKTVTVISQGEAVWRLAISSDLSAVFTFNTSSTMSVGAAGDVKPKSWNHFAITCDGTGGAAGVRTFLNGVLKSSGQLVPPSDSTTTVYVGWNTASAAWAMNGYISNLRVLKGIALYTSNFYPNNVPSTPVASQSGKNYSYPLLITGTDGGIIDLNRSNNWEVLGEAKTVQDSPYYGKYYGYQFNGSSDYLTTSRVGGWIGSGNDFTLEYWAYLTGYTPLSTSVYLACPFGTSGAANGWEHGFSGTASSYTGYTFNFKGGTPLTATYSFSLNTWYHIAVVKSGSTTSLYINGTKAASTTGFTSWTDNATMILGQLGVSGYNFWFPGVISNVRIVNGTALYTANFTPSTAPLSTVANTVLLTAQSNKFVDNSANNYTISIGANLPKITSVNPWQIAQGVSYYFDGTGDYLRAIGNPLFALGSGDFTIDYWIKPNTLAAQFTVVDFRGAASNVGFTDYITTNGKINLFQEGGTTYLTTTGAIRAGEWTHIAYVRSSGVVKVYINGVADATTANNTTAWVAPSSSTYAVIGVNYTLANYLPGYLADFRVSKGFARYTANFTVPSRPVLHAS